MDGRRERLRDKRPTDERIDGKTDRLTDGEMNEWTDGRKNGRTNGKRRLGKGKCELVRRIMRRNERKDISHKW